MRKLFTSMALVALSACGKSDSGGAGGAGAANDAPAATLPANAVADVNAAIPKEHAASLKFAARTFDEKVKILAVSPEGWTESDVIPGQFKPPESANLGFFTQFSVGTNCDGVCEAKDWAATTDKVDFSQFVDGQFNVTEDRQPGSRVIVAKNAEGTVHVRAAFWKDGAERYVICAARLDKELAAAAPAFEKACRATTPIW